MSCDALEPSLFLPLRSPLEDSGNFNPNVADIANLVC